MHRVWQFIEALEALTAEEVAELLEGHEEDFYWWLEDNYPESNEDDGMLASLKRLYYASPTRFPRRVTDFVLSDCVLAQHVADTLDIQDGE